MTINTPKRHLTIILLTLFSVTLFAQNFDIADSLHHEAIKAMQKHDMDQAIELEEKAYSLFSKTKRKEHIQVSVSALAAFYFSRGLAGDVDKAIQYNQIALNMVGKRSKDYVRIANQLIMCYAQAGNTTNAKKLSNNIFKKGKKAYTVNSVEYAKILWNQAVLMNKMNDISQAVDYAEEALQIYRETGDSTCVDYGRLLIHCASFYTSIEKYDKSLALLTNARNVLKAAEGESGSNYIRAIGDLSSIQSKLGNNEEASNLALSNQSAVKAISTENATKQKAYSLSKQADVFATSGNYIQAITVLSGAVDIFRQHGDSLGVGRTLYQLSNYYYHRDKLQTASNMCDYAIELMKNFGGKYNDLGIAYNTSAIINHKSGKDSLALSLSLQAIECFETENDTSNILFASVLATAATNFSAIHDYDKAIRYGLRTIEIQKMVLGEGHPNTVMDLFNLACFYSKKKNYLEASKFYHEAFNLQTQLVKNNFSHLTTTGREMYWQSKRYLYPMAAAFAYDDSNNRQILVDAYEALLFSKGILLNSEIDFKNLLYKSGNSRLMSKYDKLQELNSEIEALYNAASIESTAQAKEKQISASILEREIMKECKEYGDYTDNMTIGFDAISRSLKDGDVAVEFTEIESEDSIPVYVALYTRRGWDAPRITYLFSSKDLETFCQDGKSFFELLRHSSGQNYIYNNKDIGDIIWKPLLSNWDKEVSHEGLAPIHNIYFSPSSLFYRLGIEYLAVHQNDENKNLICDSYNIYRLSSTKSIAKKQAKKAIGNAVLFGDIDYDLEVEGMVVMHDAFLEELNKAESEGEDIIADTENLVTRSGENGAFIRLPATEKETADIEYVLSANNVKVKRYTSFNATEEVLKGMDGCAPDLLHIATHGFSFPEKTKARRKLAYILEGKKWTASESESSLNYSGLMFAGANNRWALSAVLPDTIDDGIATSKEIAKLNLSGLDLVVLSACQTGLGDIKDDGVFGLQRAFKKAGAHTMLMSLWKVNDEATQIMMSTFYSALMQGLSRHDALGKAQENVRQSGFTDPHYWASFILLDGN